MLLTDALRGSAVAPRAWRLLAVALTPLTAQAGQPCPNGMDLGGDGGCVCPVNT